MQRKPLLMLLLSAAALLSACGILQPVESSRQPAETAQATTTAGAAAVTAVSDESVTGADTSAETGRSATQTDAEPETTVTSEATSATSAAGTTAATAVTATSAATASSSASKTTAGSTKATVSTAATGSTSAVSVTTPSAEDAWMLVLVNDSHPLSVLTPPELVTLSNGKSVDARMYPALQAMFDAMRAKGLSPFVREGFRTNEMQQDILDTRIQKYVNQGYSKEKARSLALQYVAEPGTSEHQLGLAVDINSTDGNSWPCYNWLMHMNTVLFCGIRRERRKPPALPMRHGIIATSARRLLPQSMRRALH